MANKKESTLYILKVLETYTDQTHFLTQGEIIDYLYKDYDIVIERKSVARSINSLMELDYDIIKGPKGGFALASRTFTDSEVYYLMDAIYSSHTISKENTNELIDKLIKNSSLSLRHKAIKLYKNEEISKTDNKQIFLNIELINKAIERKKKISFIYLGFDENGRKTPKFNGFRYILSPYFLVNNFGRYYCIGNYQPKYGPLSPYRIDYIEDVKIMDDDITPLSEFRDKLQNFSIDSYINEHIYLFGGNVINAKLEIVKPSSIVYVYDWFYDKAKIVKENDKFVAYIRCDEQALLYWVMQYGEEVKVLEPQSLIDKVIVNAKELVKNHK